MIAMLATLILTLTNAYAATPLTSAAEVKAAFAKGRPMVIMFSAEWCPACKWTKPQYLEAEKQFAGKVDFYTMDTDKIGLKMKKQFSGIPAFVAGHNEKEIRSGKSLMEGGMPVFEIVKYVKQWTN
jgi:thiol-disulfide isomerase/thioredoxin